MVEDWIAIEVDVADVDDRRVIDRVVDVCDDLGEQLQRAPCSLELRDVTQALVEAAPSSGWNG